MKRIVLVVLACCSMAAVASEKVDALRKFIKEHEKTDLSTAEGDKIRDEIEARKNALSAEEKKEFDQQMMSEMMEQMQKAMKKMLEVPVDTPAAKAESFTDEDKSPDSVFGVKFGTKVEKQPIGPGSDAGPLALLANETKLKIPKPVKWFTTVSGQPDFRNKRIYQLTFRAAIPDTIPQEEVDKGVRQLEELMKAKFGADCMKEDNWKGDFRVVISDSKTMKRSADMSMALAKGCPGLEIPHTVTLCVENRRISKLDPEIPEPKDGDGFADNLKIPEGLDLAEPETLGEEVRERQYADDEVFAKALADPKDYRDLLKKTTALYKQVFRTKRELAVAYFRKNKLWRTIGIAGNEGGVSGYKFERTYWSGTQYAKIEFSAQYPLRDTYSAKKTCKDPAAGYYALLTEFYGELTRLNALKEESGIDAILPEPKKYEPPVKSDFKLVNGMQGGIYHYQATVNPGEDGEVYLRAYEVTKGTRLSADRMKQRTTEKVTGKGEHVIGIGKEFTIYEGDWDQYYAARLEIWFVPANGGKPRKLKEKLFKVQGWMF